MCGIVAILDPAAGPGELEAQVRRATASLTHRGPDDADVWVDADLGVALGHQRLSIRDPSPDGRQPMRSADGRWVLVFNGELYDAAELAATLPDRRLRGGSDTEVLLEAIAHRGVRDVLATINGMFAFAAWDRRERQLWVVRDHLGIKPLHHGRVGSALVVTSELRALHTFPAFRPEVDPQAVTDLLTTGAVPAPRTIHRGIAKLPPGRLLRVGTAGPLGPPEPWWDLRAVAASATPETRPDAVVIDDLEALLADSVQRQAVSDVPLGAFLSGGIDSSLVVALLQARGGDPLRTFAIAFDDPRFDEGPQARAVADHLGTDHTELRVREAELLDVLPALLDHTDEPFGDSSLIPTRLVAGLARRSVTVALSGDGGDELFGGYTTYQHAERLWRTLRWVPYPVRRGLGELAGGPRTDLLCRLVPPLMPGRDREQVVRRIERGLEALGGRHDTDVLERMCTVWPTADAPMLAPAGDHRAQVGPGSIAPDGPGAVAPGGRRQPPFLDRMMLADQGGYLPDTILTKTDRASMMVGLEVRVPLLDHRIVATAWGLQRHHRVRDGQQKWILRQVLRRYLPDELVDRPKRGFAVPLGAWLRGPLRPWAEDLLTHRSLAATGLLDVEAVRRTWSEHLAGRPREDGLWNLLAFLAWRQRWATT